MSEHLVSAPRWHDAAALASFPLYEAGNGTEHWAGGFAEDGSHLEVIVLVGGHEVSVDNRRPEHDAMREATRRRMSMGDLLWRHVLEDDNALALPYSIAIEVDDRMVTIDGQSYMVPGMRITGDPTWVGTMQLEEVTLKIATASPAPLMLTACADPLSLPEMPPSGR